MPAPVLELGTGRCDITPAPGTPHAGWGAQTHQRGKGADLPLYATALVLSDGAKSVAIIDLDYGGFEADFVARIIGEVSKLTGLPPEHIRLSCSHTHSGPNTFRLAVVSEGLEMALSYMESLPARIAGAVWQAQQNLRAVRCAASQGACDINVNRRLRLPDGRVVVGRNWDGSVDHTVRVVRFDDLNERPVATIVHYACHPTIMAWQNQWVTPDYPGMARKVVEEQLGGVCLFLQGAAGNIGPRRGFTGDLDVYRRLGKILGLEASKVACALEPLPRRERCVGLLESGTTIAIYEDEPVDPETPVLDVRFRQIALPLKPQPSPDELEARAAALRTELEAARRSKSEDEIRRAMARAVQAGMEADRAYLYFGKTTIEWPMQAIRIGPVVLLAVSGEPFIEIAQAIVAASPFPCTCVSGYSNGGFGYIPTRQAYEEGGYEVQTTIFSPDAAEILVREGIRMLRDMAT